MHLFEPYTVSTCLTDNYNFFFVIQAFKSYNQDSPTVTLLAHKIHHINIKSKAFASIKVKKFICNEQDSLKKTSKHPFGLFQRNPMHPTLSIIFGNCISTFFILNLELTNTNVVCSVLKHCTLFVYE
jgi:hypothetical protein